MAARPLPVERDSSMMVIRLEQPGSPVVVLNLELLQRLEATLRAVPSDTAGVVIASASKRVFVAGADLKTIAEESDEGLMAYLAYASRVFGMISALPCPTVAAINGAALGGGLELAMHCDGLVACPGVKPYPVGLPEAGLSICPGWGGTNLLPARIDPKLALEQTAQGKPMMFDDAKAADLFDAVAESADTLIAESIAWIKSNPASRRDGMPSRWIGRTDCSADVTAALFSAELPDTDSARSVATAVRAGLESGWEQALLIEQQELTRLRSTDAGKAAIQAFFDRSKK